MAKMKKNTQIHNRVALPYSKNQHSLVNQLNINKIKKNKSYLDTETHK